MPSSQLNVLKVLTSEQVNNESIASSVAANLHPMCPQIVGSVHFFGGGGSVQDLTHNSTKVEYKITFLPIISTVSLNGFDDHSTFYNIWSHSENFSKNTFQKYYWLKKNESKHIKCSWLFLETYTIFRSRKTRQNILCTFNITAFTKLGKNKWEVRRAWVETMDRSLLRFNCYQFCVI